VCALGAASICSGSCDGALSVFTRAGELLSSCQAHEGGVNALHALRTGRLLLSGGKDGHACVWRVDASDAAPLIRCAAAEHAVRSAASAT